MPDPQTPNLALYVPVNGADVSTWDVPMNANFNQLDTNLCGIATVAITNVNFALSGAQYSCQFINFTGNQTAHVTVTFPTIGRAWIVQNNCTNNTTFVIACVVNAVAGTYVCAPPGEAVMIMSDGVNMKYVGLERVGAYRDFGASAVPGWITLSSPAPYLNCDGTTFASSIYPALAAFLGGTTLPDARGRFRAALNQGTGRLTAINGNTLLSSGGSETITQANLPNYALSVTDPAHSHPMLGGVSVEINGGAVSAAFGGDFTAGAYGGVINQTANAVTGITVNSGGSGTAYVPPGYIGGLTLIRAG